MFHTNTPHHSSAAEGLRAYGLSGVELGHRDQTRRIAVDRDLQLRKVDLGGRVNNLRQRLGDAMILAGSELAGDTAVMPARAIRTKPSMS